MTTNITPGKPVRVWPYRVLAWGALVFVLVVVPVALALLLTFPWARAWYLDSYLSVALPYLLVLVVLFRLWRDWASLGRRARRVLIGLLPLLCVAAVGRFWLEWPDLPWGRADAEHTADDFMTALNMGDAGRALTFLSPNGRAATSAADLLRLAVQPVSWDLTMPPRYHDASRDGVFAQGTATFADGVELPVNIGLKWLGNRWGIFQVVFGTVGGAAGVSISACCDRAGPLTKMLKDLQALWGLAFAVVMYILSTQNATLRSQAPTLPVAR